MNLSLEQQQEPVVRVFQIDDEFYAAVTLHEALEFRMNETAKAQDDYNKAVEVDPGPMDELRFIPEDNEGDQGTSFREALDVMVERGDRFPYLFAVPE